MEMLEHPDIAKVETFGYIDPPALYACPICGAKLYEADTVYCEGPEVLGCENCLEKREAGEVLGTNGLPD